MGDAINVLEVCNARYQEIYGEYNSNATKKIIVSHFGEFSQELVNSISIEVEERMMAAGDKKGPIKRVFSILVEGLQNVRIHGERDPDGNQGSFLVVCQDDEEYLITTGNLARNEAVKKIVDKIKVINQYDVDGLKQFYMDVLTNGLMSQKGGAGLGLITMAMKSKNKLAYKVDHVDDNYSCMTIETKVNRWS